MDEDMPPGHGGGGLPTHSSHNPAFGAMSSGFPVTCDPPSSSTGAGRFTHDISHMPEFPWRNSGHRRAQSEVLSLPDDLDFDSDLGLVRFADAPSLFDDTEEEFFSAYLDVDKSGRATSGSGLPGSEPWVAAAPATPPHPPHQAESSVSGPRIRHQHSQSMDGSFSIKPELLASSSEGPSLAEANKAMAAAKLADLAHVDPNRAKRIWANRQSAARSKERKMRYIGELERKLQTLQTGATTLSAQLTLLQRDTNGLTAENNELKLRLQNMEQQVHLQDALNDALREEVQRLKSATGQMIPNGGQMISFGVSSFVTNQQYYHQNHAMQLLMAPRQLHQLQIHSQHQQQLRPHQHQYQQQQPPPELKMKGTMTSQNQRESTSDNSSNVDSGNHPQS